MSTVDANRCCWKILTYSWRSVFHWTSTRCFIHWWPGTPSLMAWHPLPGHHRHPQHVDAVGGLTPGWQTAISFNMKSACKQQDIEIYVAWNGCALIAIFISFCPVPLMAWLHLAGRPTALVICWCCWWPVIVLQAIGGFNMLSIGELQEDLIAIFMSVQCLWWPGST